MESPNTPAAIHTTESQDPLEAMLEIPGKRPRYTDIIRTALESAEAAVAKRWAKKAAVLGTWYGVLPFAFVYIISFKSVAERVAVTIGLAAIVAFLHWCFNELRTAFRAAVEREKWDRR